MAARRSLLSAFSKPCHRSLLSWNPAPFLQPSIPALTRAKSTDSTSALAYKAVHRRAHPPLPVVDSSGQYGAAAAVSNILYETPTPSQTPPKKHILNCLVQNEPGVLSRISGILAARGFNIDSLVVCSTEVEDLSRMTIVLQGLDGVVEQARRQLEDLVPVWAVLDYTSAALVQRELLLAKISILGPEVYEELMEHHREMTATEATGESDITAADVPHDGLGHQTTEESADRRLQQLEERKIDSMASRSSPPYSAEDIVSQAKDMLGQGANYHPSRLAASQALRHKHEHLSAITHLTHQFGGKVLDISTNNCIVEV